MILDRALRSSSFQTLMKCHPKRHATIASSVVVGGRKEIGYHDDSSSRTRRRFLSTNPRRLNEDNMIQHHMEHQPKMPPQEWTTFHGKIPVLTSTTTPDEDAARTNAARSSSLSNEYLHGEQPRVSVLMELQDRVGILHDILKYFWKYDINVSRIESRPVQTGQWMKPKFGKFVFVILSLVM